MADNVLWAAEELSLSIGRQTLYDNTEFSIAGGERVGLVGRNGSGKSTLFRLITGEELPGGGSITRARELRVALLPQEFRLDGSRTIAENVAEGLAWFRELQHKFETISVNSPEHAAAARRIAGEGMVLLKNDGGVLPLDLQQTKRITVIGENAVKMMTIGGGSSSLKVKHETTPLEGILAAVGERAEVVYERGYVGDVSSSFNGVETGQDLNETRTADRLIADAVAAARDADAVIFIGGLNKSANQDAEGSDRLQLGLPYGQDRLIEALAEANPHLVAVFVSGNAVAMPWIDRVPAVLEAWYSGSEAGNALADVLFGAVNPSGKLPFTFPVRLEDNGAIALGEYPGGDSVKYNESIFVGYRWAEKQQIAPLFAFGHGLSYTTFAYDNIRSDRTELASDGTIRISVDVTNTGERAGQEVVQLYVGDCASALKTAEQAAGETKSLGILRSVCRAAEALGIADKIRLDFSIVGDADYYKGVMFTGYVGGSPYPVLSGGRYDNLVKKFGAGDGGIGFAIYPDELDYYTRGAADYDADVLVLYNKDALPADILSAVKSVSEGGESAFASREIPKGMRFKRTIKL